MNEILDIAEYHVIKVLDAEEDFFEKFTKKYNIPWKTEDRVNKIFPISKSYVGYIVTPLRKINLLPKYREVKFEHIFRMYLYVYNYKTSDSSNILDVSSTDSDIDISKLFFDSLQKNIQSGIIQQYSRYPMYTRSLKGTVNFTKTFFNHLKGKKKPVQSKSFKLSLNNIYNYLIVSALKKLQHVKSYSILSTSLLMYFKDVEGNIENGSEAFKSIIFNTNTSRYRQTLLYAAMIIDNLDYDDVGNSVGGDSFLVNFDRLFEDFVAKVLKTIPENRDFSTWDDSKKYADIISQGISIDSREYLPDILYKFQEEDEKYDYSASSFAVLDIKNKAYSIFKNADVYQILMYAKLLHSQKTLLLYPAFSRRQPEKLLLKNELFEPSEVSACFINIADSSGEKFLESIEVFVKTVENIISDVFE